MLYCALPDAALNADAVVNVTCGPTPLANNYWASKKCIGKRINRTPTHKASMNSTINRQRNRKVFT